MAYGIARSTTVQNICYKGVTKPKELFVITTKVNYLMPVHIVTSESAAGSLRVGLERPKVVIGFPDSFSIGPLYKLHEKTGQTIRNEWIYEHINDEQDDDAYENKFANTVREIDDIPGPYPIYIWYGNNADEQTGLRFLLFLLRNKTNDLFLMNSNELHKSYIMPNGGDAKFYIRAKSNQKIYVSSLKREGRTHLYPNS